MVSEQLLISQVEDQEQNLPASSGTDTGSPEVDNEILVSEESQQASINPESDALLQQFWSLASLDANTRQSAAIKLIELLYERQQAFPKNISLNHQENGSVQSLDNQEIQALCHADVLYALHRLVRGLASGRAAARQGFALALTELLSTVVPFLPARYLIESIKKSTAISGNLKGYEERDLLYGRLFGFMAMIRAGKITGPVDITADVLADFIAEIFKIAHSKPYMRQYCSELMICLLRSIKSHELTTMIIDCLQSEDIQKLIDSTADFLAVAIELQNQELYPVEINWNLLLTNFELVRPQEILQSENYSVLVPILRETTGNSHPKTHIVWTYILDYLMMPQNLSAIQDFWRTVVDEGLFVSSLHEKKFLGFQLFDLIVQSAKDVKDFPYSYLFTHNFISCLFNNMGNSTSNLNKVAHATFNNLLQATESNRSIALQFLASMSGCKNVELSQFRKTGRNQQLLDDLMQAGLSGENDSGSSEVTNYVEWLIQSFCNQESDETKMDEDDDEGNIRRSSAEMHRQWCLDQMVALVKNTRILKNKEWVFKIMRFMILLGFYEPAPAVSEQSLLDSFPELGLNLASPLTTWTRHIVRRRFWSFISELSSRKFNSESENMEGFVSNDDHVLWCAWQFINQLDTLQKPVKDKKKASKKAKGTLILKPTRVEWDAEIQQIIKSSQNLAQKIHSSLQSGEAPRQHQNRQKFFLLLLCLVNLQIKTSMDEDEVGELASVLEELQSCHSKLFTGKIKPTTELNPVSVLTDVIISLLARQPESEQNNKVEVKSSMSMSIRLSRQICETVFRSICIELDTVGIETLGKVIDPVLASSLEGMEIEEDDDSHHSHHSDHSDHENCSHSHASDSDDSDSDQNDEDIDEKFRMQIEEALKSKENEEEVGSDDDLDDEQMMSLGFDAKLAEIFRTRKLQQKQKRDAIQLMADIKFRVLDLISVYARQICNACNHQESVDFSPAGDIVIFLLRAALTHSNTTGAIQVAKDAMKSSSQPEATQAFLSYLTTNVAEIPIERRNNLSMKMLDIIKSRLLKIHISKRQTLDISSVKSKLEEIRKIILNESSDAVYPLPSASKEVLLTACETFLWFVKCILNQADDIEKTQIFDELEILFSKHFLVRHLNKSGKGHLPASIFIEAIKKNAFGNDSEENMKQCWKVFGSNIVKTMCENMGTGSIGKYQQSQLWHLLSHLIRHTDPTSAWWIEKYASSFSDLCRKTLEDLATDDSDTLKAQKVKDSMLVMMEAIRKMKKKSDKVRNMCAL